jgi:hypothetical protein
VRALAKNIFLSPSPFPVSLFRDCDVFAEAGKTGKQESYGNIESESDADGAEPPQKAA